MVLFCCSSFFSMRQDTPHFIETSLDHLLFSLDLFSYEASVAIQNTLDLLWPFTFLPPLDLVCDKCCEQKYTSIFLGLPPLDLLWGQCSKTRSHLMVSFSHSSSFGMRQELKNKTLPPLFRSKALFCLSRSALILYCSHSSSFTVKKLVLDLTRPALIVSLLLS